MDVNLENLKLKSVDPKEAERLMLTSLLEKNLYILNTDSEFEANLHFARQVLRNMVSDPELVRESLECILSYIVRVN